MKKYDVSIIVPIYNVEKYIERCATTLFEQDYDNIEYIFVNDCTPDRSMNFLQDAIEKYPNRKNHVKIINNFINIGSSMTRKNGLDASSGKYILFVDSDDWIELDMISSLVCEAKKSNADIVCCDMILHYKNRQIYKKDQHKDINNEYKLKALIGGYVLPSMPNKLIRREIFSNIIFPKFQFGEDVYIMIQAFYYSKNIKYIKKPFFHYNKLNESSLSTNINEKTIIDIKNMYFSICDFLKDKNIYDELIDFHRTRLISVVFYNLNDSFIKNLKAIDKKSARVWLILQNNKFSLLQKIICLLPFIGLDKLFIFIREFYKKRTIM
ncbi:MAG: glycosyltransferase family 2 protein [Campylobacter sp.]